MNRTHNILVALLISWPLSTAAADTVTLKDGSLLKGKIKRVENGELILDTDYADDVSIDVEHIVGVASDQEYTVRLIGGEKLSGFLAVSDGTIFMRRDLKATRESEAIASPEEIEPADAEPLVDSTPNLPAEEREFRFDDVDRIDQKQSYFWYVAEINIGAQVAKGNTDTTDLHLDALFEPTFGRNTLRLAGEFDKKEADGDTTTNRWRTSLEYERGIGRRWFIGAANSYEGDVQRDLELRIIAAAGAGYRFFNEDPTFLSVMPAIAYVIETFEDSNDDTDYAAFHWKFNLTRDLYKDDISIYHNHLYLNSLKDLSDIIIETRTGIEFDLAWDFTLSAEFQSYWDNIPAGGADKLDTRYILKIGYEFDGDQEDWFQ